MNVTKCQSIRFVIIQDALVSINFMQMSRVCNFHNNFALARLNFLINMKQLRLKTIGNDKNQLNKNN